MVLAITLSAPSAARMNKKFIKKASRFSKGENPKRVMLCAFLVERDAKKKAPIDTGRLRASIRSQKLTDESAKVFTDVEYAPNQEFPTAGRPGKYFMTNALANNKNKILLILGTGVKVAVRA